MYEQHDDSSWSFAIGLFIGATFGAALASLFSPRSGQQNREAVREQGLVLKSRVSNATTSAATTVKDRTDIVVARINDTATTVKEKTSSAVETVSETASSAATTVKDKASSAVETVKERASSAVETVSETASSAAAKVQDVASTAAAKVQDVAGTATEKARTLTQGGASANDEIVVANIGELANEASYDAEDVRPATTARLDTAASELSADIAAVNPNQASTDRPVDATSSLSDPIIEVDLLDTAGDGASIEELVDPDMAELDQLDAAPDTAYVAATSALADPQIVEVDAVDTAGDVQSDAAAAELTSDVAVSAAQTAELSSAETTDSATSEALAELSSDEQFEVDPGTAAGTDADVREASEGAERGS